MTIQLKWGKETVTDYASSITWSGSQEQASRICEFTIANNPYDERMDQLNIKLGDQISLYEDERVLFLGTVTKRERSSDIGTISYTAQDFMHYLLRSKVQKVYRNKTAEAITKALCNDIGISTKKLIKTNVSLKKIILDSESYYNGIIKAYRKAAVTTKKKYMPAMDGKYLTVIEKGLDSGVILDQSVDIIQASYSDDTESMINKVIIYDDKGKKQGTVKKESWIQAYGIYQDNYAKEDGVDAKAAAEKILMGIEKTASVEAVGDTKAMAGYAVKIIDDATGLKGTFWIDSDSHAFEDGNHVMSLDLVFKNIMEKV